MKVNNITYVLLVSIGHALAFLATADPGSAPGSEDCYQLPLLQSSSNDTIDPEIGKSSYDWSFSIYSDRECKTFTATVKGNGVTGCKKFGSNAGSWSPGTVVDKMAVLFYSVDNCSGRNVDIMTSDTENGECFAPRHGIRSYKVDKPFEDVTELRSLSTSRGGWTRSDTTMMVAALLLITLIFGIGGIFVALFR